jgi:Ser/Thr protein kinase RdoA (MazF antagonist)
VRGAIVKNSDLLQRVLARYENLENAVVSPLGNGLINQTFLVTTPGRQLVLQRLSPIFSPVINENIAAVTRALAAAGLATPHLVPTREGRLWADLGDQDGVWRVQTFVAGTSFDKVQGPAQARSAGALVARFHRAVDDLDHSFVGVRAGVHDTAKHLTRLREALALHSSHRLIAQVTPVAQAILRFAADLPALPDLPARICHGDLKLNNILFHGSQPPASQQACCLIDLDTVGPMALAYELGDAWRSWCNRSGEDAVQAAIDLDVLRASFDGYAEGIARDLTRLERQALLAGVEWISLELAARFAADALYENYFGWNQERYASRGDHNLVRGRGQLALHEAFVATRSQRTAIVGL